MIYYSTSIRRKEDERLITGAGRYVGDLHAPRMLHASFVRADVAHGLIESVDLSESQASPGVVAAFTGRDLRLPDLRSNIGPAPVVGMDRPILGTDRVRHVGEAVAMIVAETPAAAADATDLAWIDFAPLPVVMTAQDAMVTPVVLHPGCADNIVERFTLGVQDNDWDYEVETTVTVASQRVAPIAIEGLACLAVPDGDGVKLWVGHQSPHRLKRQLAGLVDFPVEVAVPDVGGGFGMKARIFPEYVAIVAAAHRLGRPVRWLQSRREGLMTGTHGRDITHTIRIAGDRTGRVRRAHVDLVACVGAYPHVGSQVATFARLVAQGLYDIEHVTVSSTTVVTNTAPIAPYRGAGRPEAAYGIERAIEAFARSAQLDPVEVRRTNMFSSDALPHTTTTGATYDSGDYHAALTAATDRIGLSAARQLQTERRQQGGALIGVGFGAFVERAGGPANSEEYAKVTIQSDGRVTVHTGSTSNGQGHETVWAQVAGQVFDIAPQRVDVVAGDTSKVERGWGSTASRSAQIGASGVWRTAQRVRTTATEVAAELLEASPSDLRLADGVFSVAGVPGSGITLAEVAEAAEKIGKSLTDHEWYSPGAQTFPYGVHAAVVEVDVETGLVRLLRYAAVDDCGNVLSPMIVEGQTHGSVAQGVGQALYERIAYDESGQLTSGSLMDYIVPHATEVPFIITSRIVSPAPSNPLGVKGAGEGGCIGAPPAIVNATLDALRHLGVTHLDTPLTPSSVWHAIESARRSGANLS